ncbi:MAG: HAMP domain-containing sensor histidine kinase [Phaeodactylibacter sp.]|uniref:HAMP domain-containing sensor histidine kinase n=1 Tax=Phaeodactylibacter sp. TaxID=1940289 RepID=UPI0032EDD82B
MKLKNRLALNFALFTSGILFLMGGLIFLLYGNYLEDEFTSRLHERCMIASQMYLDDDELSPQVLEQIRQKHTRTLPSEQEYFFHLERKDSILPYLPDFLAAKLSGPYSEAQEYFKVEKGDTLGVGILYRDDQGPHFTIVTAVNRQGNQELRELGNILFGLAGLHLVSIFFIARWYARRMLSPLTEMTEKMKTVDTANLHIRLHPLPGQDPQDELGSIVEAFNKMLARLETSVETQRNFITHASHQFNTPLTTILGEIELVRQHYKSLPPAVAESMNNISEESERLNRLTLRLLHLAEVGTEGVNAQGQSIRIDELLFQIQEELKAAHPEHPLWIDTATFPDDPDALVVNGNINLLQIALFNLAENGLKYSQAPVKVFLSVDSRYLSVHFQDEGMGISESELEAVFTPFFRGQNVQSRPGYGVGLPLAQKIIELHHGTIYIQSEPGKGTLATARLPLEQAFI